MRQTDIDRLLIKANALRGRGETDRHGQAIKANALRGREERDRQTQSQTGRDREKTH